jgi:hypothetical protein
MMNETAVPCFVFLCEGPESPQPQRPPRSESRHRDRSAIAPTSTAPGQADGSLPRSTVSLVGQRTGPDNPMNGLHGTHLQCGVNLPRRRASAAASRPIGPFNWLRLRWTVQAASRGFPHHVHTGYDGRCQVQVRSLTNLGEKRAAGAVGRDRCACSAPAQTQGGSVRCD